LRVNIISNNCITERQINKGVLLWNYFIINTPSLNGVKDIYYKYPVILPIGKMPPLFCKRGIKRENPVIAYITGGLPPLFCKRGI